MEISKDTLNELFNNLRNLEKCFIESTKRFLKAGDGKLYTMDLFASTVNNWIVRALQTPIRIILVVNEDEYGITLA